MLLRFWSWTWSYWFQHFDAAPNSWCGHSSSHWKTERIAFHHHSPSSGRNRRSETGPSHCFHWKTWLDNEGVPMRGSKVDAKRICDRSGGTVGFHHIGIYWLYLSSPSIPIWFIGGILWIWYSNFRIFIYFILVVWHLFKMFCETVLLRTWPLKKTGPHLPGNAPNWSFRKR